MLGKIWNYVCCMYKYVRKSKCGVEYNESSELHSQWIIWVYCNKVESPRILVERRRIQIPSEKVIFLAGILILLRRAITRLDNRQTGMNMNIYCVLPCKDNGSNEEHG